MVAATAVIVSFLAGGLDNLVLLAPDRDSVTGRVTLDTFLNYGRLSIGTTIFGFVTGGIPHGDNTYYVGLLSLAFFTYALITSGDKVFMGSCQRVRAHAVLGCRSEACSPTAIYHHFREWASFGISDWCSGSRACFCCWGRDSESTGWPACSQVARSSRDVPPWKRCGWLCLVAGLMLADLWFHLTAIRPGSGVPAPAMEAIFAFRLLVCLAGIGITFLGHLSGTESRGRRSGPDPGTGSRADVPAGYVQLSNAGVLHYTVHRTRRLAAGRIPGGSNSLSSGAKSKAAG